MCQLLVQTNLWGFIFSFFKTPSADAIGITCLSGNVNTKLYVHLMYFFNYQYVISQNLVPVRCLDRVGDGS